jgi:ribonuclease P protein component
MLLKQNRVDTKTIEEIFKKGVFLNTPNLTFRFIKNTTTLPPRVSVIAPKTIAKGAVGRNLLRRRGYRILKGKLKEFPLGLVGVLVFKNKEATSEVLAKDLELILKKI